MSTMNRHTSRSARVTFVAAIVARNVPRAALLNAIVENALCIVGRSPEADARAARCVAAIDVALAAGVDASTVIRLELASGAREYTIEDLRDMCRCAALHVA